MIQDKDVKNIDEKEIKKQDSQHSIWTETPLSKFGNKCVMNKHKLCIDSKCECLCHHDALEEVEHQ